jgi:hypothetical protein
VSLKYATQNGLSFRANGAPNVFQFGGGESKDLRLLFDELQTHYIGRLRINTLPWRIIIGGTGAANCPGTLPNLHKPPGKLRNSFDKTILQVTLLE